MSVAASDALQEIKAEQERAAARESQIIEAGKRAAKEAEILQKDVYLNANPNPIFVVCMVIGIILIIYVIYMVFVAKRLSGLWVELDGNGAMCGHVWKIKHNPLTGTVRVKIYEAGDDMGDADGNLVAKFSGMLKGSALIFQSGTGIWMARNVVYLYDGHSLNRMI